MIIIYMCSVMDNVPYNIIYMCMCLVCVYMYMFIL